MSRERPFHPILLRMWLGCAASGYLHSWAAAILDHLSLDRFALVCEVVGISSGLAAVPLAIAYLSYRGDES